MAQAEFNRGGAGDRGRLRLGARPSPLSLVQARHVRDCLAACDPAPTGPPEILPITSDGDRIQDRPLREVGGKGLFTKTLDAALLDGRCEAAVHSLKDMETRLAPGITIACILPRADARDVFFANGVASLMDLAPGARIGTCSLRRAVQVLARRTDLRIVDLRGNVETRLQKLRDGQVDATLLACAGLMRLGLPVPADGLLSPEQMLPAVGQGAIAVTVLRSRDDLRARLMALNDADAAARTGCERAFLAALDGSCRTPIAGYAEIAGDGRLHFRGLAARPDGSHLTRVEEWGAVADAARLGHEAGQRLKAEMGGHDLR